MVKDCSQHLGKGIFLDEDGKMLEGAIPATVPIVDYIGQEALKKGIF